MARIHAVKRDQGKIYLFKGGLGIAIMSRNFKKGGKMRKAFSVLFALICAACGSSGSNGNNAGLTASQYDGNWTLTGLSVNGSQENISGMSENLNLNGTSATATYSGGGCAINYSFSFTVTGNSYTELPGTAICTPVNCSISYSVGGNPVSLGCQNFPVTENGTASVGASTLSVSTSVGSASEVETFTK